MSYAPIRTYNVRVDKPLWITDEITELLGDRERAFEDAIKLNDDNLLAEAKRLRTELKIALRNAKTEYIRNNLNNNKNNPKNMWAEMNKLIKSNSKNSTIELKDENGLPVPSSLASLHINNYFASIGPKLAEKFGEALPLPLEPLDLTTSFETSLTLNEISSSQLYNEIKNINIYKSSGISGISSRLLKDAMKTMLHEFTFLLNKSILTGNVRSAWKKATVVPTPKVTNSPHVSDLRPIIDLYNIDRKQCLLQSLLTKHLRLIILMIMR